MKTILLIDSSSDLPLEFIQDNNDNIAIVGMPVNINGKDYVDDFGKTLSHKEFYQHLRNGIIPSTAQINTYTFIEKFKDLHNKGYSIIYIGFTSGMSGTFNNAILAKETFLEENPEADITLVDSKSASIGEGVLVVHAVEMLKNGCSKDEIVTWLEENKMKTNHWFSVNDLMYLKKGGRISSTTATVGTLLNVKPVLIVNKNGELKPYTNVRGRKKSINFLFNKFKEHIENSEETIAIIGHGDCLEDAQKLEVLIRKEFNLKRIIISELSSTIASHVGPDMIALAFLGEEREDK